MFGTEIYDAIYNRYSLKYGIAYVFSHYYTKMKVDSYDPLPLENSLKLFTSMLTWHNALIHISPVLNKDQNQYYYNLFLEKCSYQ